MKKCVWVLLLLLSFIVYADESIIEVIRVYNRPASEIQPLLNPLLEGTDQVRADGSNLLVKTTPERLANIQEFIQKLDARQNNFMITVLQSRQTTAADLNAALRAQIAYENNQAANSRLQIMGHVYQTEDHDANESKQMLRTLEGQPAFIKSGKIFPVQNTQIYQNGYGNVGISTTNQMQEASTGFMVTPRLSGQQVSLDVAPWSDNLTQQGNINTQSAQTVIRVNLGEWVELGAVNESGNYSGTGSPVTLRQTNDNQMHMLIKVDKAN